MSGLMVSEPNNNESNETIIDCHVVRQPPCWHLTHLSMILKHSNIVTPTLLFNQASSNSLADSLD